MTYVTERAWLFSIVAISLVLKSVFLFILGCVLLVQGNTFWLYCLLLWLGAFILDGAAAGIVSCEVFGERRRPQSSQQAF